MATATARFSSTTADGTISAQLAVQQGDLRPVGLGGLGGFRVAGRDSGLQLVGTRRCRRSAASSRLMPSAISADVPAGPVLLLQADEVAVVVEPGGAPRVLEQHEREQPGCLGLVGHQPATAGGTSRMASPLRSGRSRSSPAEAA